MRSQDRLDTGMKPGEAIARAEAWWEKTGRKLMIAQAQRAGATPKEGINAFQSLNPDNPNFLPSGILNGEPWDLLTTREKMMLTKAWHHFAVRRPDKLGVDPGAEFKFQDRGEIT